MEDIKKMVIDLEKKGFLKGNTCQICQTEGGDLPDGGPNAEKSVKIG